MLLIGHSLSQGVFGRTSRRRHGQVLNDASILSPVEGAVAAATAEDPTEQTVDELHDTVCSCLCCFQGGCVAIPNATFAVESCDGCSMDVCQQRIAELENLWSTTSVGRTVQRPPCLVLHVSETQICARGVHCKHFTAVHAQCVDRGEYFQKYSCIIWLTCLVGLVVRSVVMRIRKHFGLPAVRR